MTRRVAVNRLVRVVHVGKFYPPVPGGIERVVQSLCEVTKGRLESRVLAFNTGRRTMIDEVDGVPVTRVGTWGSAGSVPWRRRFRVTSRRSTPT